MKNEYKVTKELMMSWAKEYHLHGKANIVRFVVFCVAAVLGLFYLLLGLFAKQYFIAYLGALLLFIVVYKLFFARIFGWKNRYKMFSKTYGVTEWIRTIEFMDEVIVVTDHTSVSQMQYKNIERIKDMGNCVLLFLNHNIALRIYKDTFVEGTWEECKAKIETLRHQ